MTCFIGVPNPKARIAVKKGLSKQQGLGWILLTARRIKG